MQSLLVIVIALLMQMEIPLSEGIGLGLGGVVPGLGGVVEQLDSFINGIIGQNGQCSELFDGLLKNVTIHGLKLSADTCLEGNSNQENILKEINSNLQNILNKLAQCEGYRGEILRTNDKILQLQITLMHILIFTQSSDYNGTYYLLSKFPKSNKEQSQILCEQAGGTLATINDPQELDFLSQFLYMEWVEYVLIADHEGLQCTTIYSKDHWKLFVDNCQQGGKFLCEVKKKV